MTEKTLSEILNESKPLIETLKEMKVNIKENNSKKIEENYLTIMKCFYSEEEIKTFISNCVYRDILDIIDTLLYFNIED